MIKKTSRKIKKNFRHKRIRKKIFGTEQVPRVSVFKSSKNIYAQIIDDVNKTTLVSVSTLTPKVIEVIEGTEKMYQQKLMQLVVWEKYWRNLQMKQVLKQFVLTEADSRIMAELKHWPMH